MDQAQWAQTEIALLPTEQIALRPSVQQKSLSHMPLETLAASMAREGLREPILVRAAAQGYIIVEGNRRLMACRMLGWREIPARVQPKDVSDMTSAGEIFAALRARPMGYLDRAEATNRLTADFGVPRAAIAQQTGDSAAHVLSLQRIATLDDRTRDILRQEQLPERVAEALTRVVDAESRQRIALRTAKERLDIREVELIGTALGLYASVNKVLDNVLMRLCDGLKAIPNILLAITLMAVLGANMKNVIISLTIVSIPGVARIARSQALLAREQTYAEAMTAVGASRTRILWRHILPNILSPIIVQMTFTFATAIISEASLSFLGAGIPSPYPSWGGMLNEARGYVYMGWWMIVFPAIFTALSVLGFNLFGDGLRDLIDPLSGR